MHIYDITLGISPALVVWPGDPPVNIEHVRHLSRGDHATVSRLSLSAHTGTHVDAPCHFVPGGKSIDDLDLDVLVGPAMVIQISDSAAITVDVLRDLDIPPHTVRLLFKTRNSELWNHSTEFVRDYIAITPDAAQWLIERGVRLVGIDYLSVAPFSDTAPTHRLLLEAGVVPLEGLDLTSVPPGRYELVCLPLNIIGGDGAPARAILVGR